MVILIIIPCGNKENKILLKNNMVGIKVDVCKQNV